MAVDSYDPTTGAPQFSDGGAPDIGVDPTEVGKYAADVGNRVVRSSLAELELYGFKRAGLAGYATDTNTEYRHDGTNWVKRFWDTGWQNVTGLASGWSAQTPDILEYRVKDGLCYMNGRIDSTTGAGNTVFTLSSGARPSREFVHSVRTTSVTEGPSFVVVIRTTGEVVVLKGSSAVNDLPLSSVPPFMVA